MFPNRLLIQYHPWLRERLSAILAALPRSKSLAGPHRNTGRVGVWQAGLTMPFTLPQNLPPLRLLLVWDNLAGQQDARPGAVAVRAWRHAALHARGRQLAQHWQSRLSACSSVGRWMDSIRTAPTRSGAGLSRPRGAGMSSPRRLSGTANAGSGAADPVASRSHRLGGSGACTHRPLHRNQPNRASECQIHQQMTP